MTKKTYSVELHYVDCQTKADSYLTLGHSADPDTVNALYTQYAAAVRRGLLGVPGVVVELQARGPLPAPPHGKVDIGWEVLKDQDSHGVYQTYAAAMYSMVKAQLVAPAPGWSIGWCSQPSGGPKKFGGFGVS